MPRILPKRVRRLADALGSFSKDSLKNTVVEVGIVDPNITYDDGTRVVDVAAWNEFGTSTIPPRPAFRTAVNEHRGILSRRALRQARDMLYRRKRFDTVAKENGGRFVEEIQKSIRAWDTPPNAESTIERKGFDDPLIDTELMVDSVDFKLLKTRRDQVK